MSRENKKETNVIGWLFIFAVAMMAFWPMFIPYRDAVQQLHDETLLAIELFGTWPTEIIGWLGFGELVTVEHVRHVRQALVEQFQFVSHSHLLMTFAGHLSLFLFRVSYRMGLLMTGLVFYLPLGSCLFAYYALHREKGKGRFSFTSPFRLRWHQMLSNFAFGTLLLMMIYPLGLHPMLFFAMVGVWVVLQSSVIASMQKRI